MDSVTKFFGEGAVTHQFGNPKMENPKVQWPHFINQLTRAATAVNSTPEWAHYLHSDATYAIIYGAENPRPVDDAPAQPANNAGQGAWADYKDLNSAWKARKAAERQFIDSDILQAFHENHVSTISEEVNGVDIGTLRRTLPEVFNLCEAAYATADIHAIRMVQQRMATQAYNPANEHFRSFSSRFMHDHAFLARNHELPAASQLFDHLKAAVSSCMHKATESFEEHRPVAEWTMPNLMIHLTDYFDRHEATITAHQVINEAKFKAPTKASTKHNAAAPSENMTDQITALLGKVPSAVQLARIEKVINSAMKRAVTWELNPKVCDNHPDSISHTTAKCQSGKK